jgi:hypothetical protein
MVRLWVSISSTSEARRGVMSDSIISRSASEATSTRSRTTRKTGREEKAVEKRRKGEEKEHTVRRENTHMTTPNKLLVIQTKDRIIRIQEFRMENDFNPISRSVEEFNSSDLVQDGIIGVVGHVVCGNGG